MDLALLSALNAERAARRACVLVTDLGGGGQWLVREEELAREPWVSRPLSAALHEALRSGKSGSIESEGRALFLSVQAPPVKLVVTGAVHISQALVSMARELTLDMTVIDPRTAFASPERFPSVRLIAEWPGEALKQVPLDRYTAFVALTHDPKIDDPALEAALRSTCFYVGALGSRKTHAKRVERLVEAGFSFDQIARIRAPIGLNIGAVSPAEIALSIVGEIVSTLRADRLAGRARTGS
ncbi:MAG: XdhC family protein [Hyphomicrobiales bacterium]|nr:XdhC family protein [Hyphomicrobiales bacterium]